jgi:ribosomal protein S18 acetylase RimI-like enzyme
MDDLEIRAATRADLGELGKMAGELVRMHHALDPLRFFLVPDVDAGYAHFLGSQLDDPDTILLTAWRGGARVGYAYARLEGRDWNLLLDACGALHDIYVTKGERRRGVASALLLDVSRRLRERGAPRVVLGAAAPNAAAQEFFARHGFRRTMVEMTCEL